MARSYNAIDVDVPVIGFPWTSMPVFTVWTVRRLTEGSQGRYYH